MIRNVIYKWKLVTYNLLVNHNQYVKGEYQYYMANRERRNFLCSVAKIVALNIKYVVFKQGYRKMPAGKYPETVRNIIPLPEELASELSKADVVSFDVFDTLLFRPFSDPKTLFYLLGIEFGIADFRQLREEAEKEARMRTEKKDREVDIVDIYKILREWCHIPVEDGVQKEIALEKKLCFANPYMKEVFEQVKKREKIVILLSDMYLTQDALREILSENGIYGYDEILLSNEYHCNKANGQLFLQAEKLCGEGKKFYHIGDNLHSDVEMAKKQGWKAYHYKNVNQIGKYYRPNGMSPLSGSIYDGLVNTWLYGKMTKYSLHYEFGFCCGGVLAVAYCQWLERLAEQNGIDRFWFVARDGDILYKLYKKYWGSISCEYIAFSRAASEQLIADDFMQEYINNAIKTEVYFAPSETLNIRQLFDSLGIGEMCSLLPYKGLSEESVCKKEIYSLLCQFLYQNKEAFDSCFSDARKGAKLYFEEKAAGAKKICVVDVGWRGSSISYIKHLFEKKYRWDIEVLGALLCSNEASYSDANELFQVIHVFCSSKSKEADWIPLLAKYWKSVEMLFSSEAPTLLSYGMQEGKPDFLYAESNENAQIVHQLQQGIMDFAEWYFTRMQPYAHAFQISGRDAIMPLIWTIRNKKLVKRIEEDYAERINDRHVRGGNNGKG